MKKIIVVLFFTILLSINELPAQERPGVINHAPFIADLDIYQADLYKYDAVLTFMRTIDNRKAEPGETYDQLQYKCYAEAYFYKDLWHYVAVDSVTVNGTRLDAQRVGNYSYYMTTSKYIYNISPINPKIRWSVYDGEISPRINADSLEFVLRFPDFYYIKSYDPNITLTAKADWNITVSKWFTSAGFTLSRPDMLKVWFLGPTAEQLSSLRNIQPCIRIDNVSANEYSGGILAQYAVDVYKGSKILAGTGCGMVRTYKFYPVNLTDSRTGARYYYLFVMGVEAEVPVTLNE
jgi:hypothetical protein